MTGAAVCSYCPPGSYGPAVAYPLTCYSCPPGTANPLAPTCPGASRTTHTAFDGAGQTTDTYKGWGSPDQITYAHYTYGNDGEVATTQDANSNVTSSVYDGYLRLWRSCFSDSSGACNSTSSNPSDFEQFAYDWSCPALTDSRSLDSQAVPDG